MFKNNKKIIAVSTPRRHKKPARFTDIMTYTLPIEKDVPINYREAKVRGKAKDWKGAKNQMDSLH